MAQAVPTATQLPCVADLPLGWSVGHGGDDPGPGRCSWSAWATARAEPVTVTLTETCPAPVEGTQQIPVDGGCVTYRSTVNDPDVPSFGPDGGLSFTPRADLIAAVAAEDDQVLCGALAPPCPSASSDSQPITGLLPSCRHLR